MELLALGIPWLLIFLSFIALYCLFARKLKLFITIIIFFVIINCHYQCVPFYILPLLSNIEEPAFSVMTFNCNYLLRYEDRAQRREQIKCLIQDNNPDVVFLTENFTNEEDSLWIDLRESYPFRSRHMFSTGNQIYSKYDILRDSVFRDDDIVKGIIFCQINYQGTTIDIFGVHLSSNNYNKDFVPFSLDNVDSKGSLISYLTNINNAEKHRTKELEIVCNCYLNEGNLTQSITPTIVMGDFNDVWGSPSLNLMGKVGLKDIWWSCGSGYGATIHRPLPFRIDHILYNNKLLPLCVKKVDTNRLSDHDALVARFSIR